MSLRYKVVFYGEIAPGHSVDQVRASLKRLLKISDDYVDRMLASRAVVLKKATDKETALNLCQVLGKSGIVCEMTPLDPTPSEQQTVPTDRHDTQSDVAVPVARGSDIEMVGTIRVAGSGFSGPWTVAERGASMAPEGKTDNTTPPSIDHISLAPAGADIPQLKEDVTPVVVDTSHLKLE